MKISQLHYFTTVAQLENISKAAELLHISQPTLSKNIAALETELMTPHFQPGLQAALTQSCRKTFPGELQPHTAGI